MAKEAYTLSSPVRIHQTREYATRLLLVNNHLNPRDQLGKLGITFHSPLTAWERFSIKAKVQLLNEAGDAHEEIMYLNRNSIRKYLRSLTADLEVTQASDQQLIDELNKTSWTDHHHNADAPGFQGARGLRHAGHYNQQKVFGFWSSLWNKTAGRFFSWLYLNTVDGINRFKLRFAFLNREKDYFEISEKLATRRFRRAKETVPAYQEFLQQEGFVEEDETTLAHIPQMSKDKYIKPNAKKDWETHIGGKLPEIYKIDTSTGTTEAPTVWVRSKEEIETVQDSMKTAWQILSGHRKPMIINAFALGPWATGLSVHEIARQIGASASIGADADKILQTIEHRYAYEQSQIEKQIAQFKKKLNSTLQAEETIEQKLIDLTNQIITDLTVHPKMHVHQSVNAHLQSEAHAYLRPYKSHFLHLIRKVNAEIMQISVTGYPPFLLELGRYAAKKGFDLKKYRVFAGVGGQAIGEPMRKAMEACGFMKVSSSFGASDLDINLGIETETEVEIRRVLEDNAPMARELFGGNRGVPMIFRFDPLNYHIQCGKESNHLIMTCNRANRSSPRISYNIKDEGRVFAASDLFGMLAKYGIFSPGIDKSNNLPFLFVWGRDSTAGFGTCNVPFDELESAIQAIDNNNNILKRAFYKYEHDHLARFDLWLELNDGIEFFTEEDSKAFHAQLINEMSERNEYFAEEINRLKDDDLIPKMQLFKRGCSPIAEPGGQRKQVLIFDKNISNTDYPAANRQTSQLTKKEYLELLAHRPSATMN